MKKLLFVGALLFALQASAQTYEISFEGTGASSTISTIYVENLSTGSTVTLSGGDILRLSSAVGIDPAENGIRAHIIVYPNPINTRSLLSVVTPGKGNAVISIYDISGKKISGTETFIDNQLQQFALSGFKEGIYFVNIKGAGYQYSAKFISNGNAAGDILIEKEGGNPASVKLSSDNDTKGSMAVVDMEYTVGDILLATVEAENYTTVEVLTPQDNETVTVEFIGCIDGDDNGYPVVKIGNQVWMAKNLETTSFRDGTAIGTTDPADLDISSSENPVYQWAYEGNEEKAAEYGRLYTWYAAVDDRNICPDGWHLPSDAEWTTLSEYLGGVNSAAIKLKETGSSHWFPGTSIAEATNESGFTALPGGTRSQKFGFGLMTFQGAWWSATDNAATEADLLDAWYRMIDFNTEFLTRDYMAFNKRYGLSVRCLKD